VCGSGGAVSSWSLLIRRHQRARCQAEFPLIVLSKIPEPALGDGTSVGKTFHRIEEAVLRREVEVAGFKLVGEGNFWRHPEDTRDFSVQPPPTKPVDEFVLKFQKPM
jgi:hypothetical protein